MSRNIRSYTNAVEEIIKRLGKKYQTQEEAKKGLVEEILGVQADIAWDAHVVGSMLTSDEDILTLNIKDVLAEIPNLNRSLGKAEKLGGDMQSVMLAAIALALKRSVDFYWDEVEAEIDLNH